MKEDRPLRFVFMPPGATPFTRTLGQFVCKLLNQAHQRVLRYGVGRTTTSGVKAGVGDLENDAATGLHQFRKRRTRAEQAALDVEREQLVEHRGKLVSFVPVALEELEDAGIGDEAARRAPLPAKVGVLILCPNE